jgi:sulfotransferase
MEKNYYFLSGLPRSGNTLLSALLNQNPEIYSSPISPVATYMSELSRYSFIEQSARNKEYSYRTDNVLKEVINSFYSDVDKKHIIDRERTWGLPDNLDLIKKHITPTPKIIFTVRDILEIIASFILLDENFLKNEAFKKNHISFSYRSALDVACDSYMSLDGKMDYALNALSSAFAPENKGMFHIVEYNDLVLNPEKTMKDIYNFLEIDAFEHNFNKIEKVETDDDLAVGLPKDLHSIKETLSKSLTNSDILSDYIRHKYSNMEFWRTDSLMKIYGKDFTIF